MPLYLGVDGGGSSTIAVVVDDALNVLGQGNAGPSNYHAVGEDLAMANVLAAAASAAQAARVQQKFKAAAFCLSGIRRPPDFDRMQPKLAALCLAKRIVLDHDASAAHRAALGGKPGVVVIAGTGSFAFGVDEHGQRFTAGGWGPLLGDEGSGYWIVLEGIKHVLAEHDKGDPVSPLAEVILKEFEAADMFTLVDRIYHGGLSREQIAAVAPSIFYQAKDGDASANRILQNAAKHLAEFAARVAEKIYPQGSVPVISYQGSMFQPGGAIVNAFEDRIREMKPLAQILPPRHEPVIGAAQLALELNVKT